MVRDVCAELGLPYLVHRTFRTAIAAHFRWIRTLGRGLAPTAA